MAYLDQTDFLAFTGLCEAEINTPYLTHLIAGFQGFLDEELDSMFTLAPTSTRKYFGGKLPISSFNIQVWQKTGLVVKYGHINGTEEVLTLDDDYTLISPENGPDNVVFGVRLSHQSIGRNGYLKIEGTKGWSDGLPPKLFNALYQAAKDAYNYNQATSQSIALFNSEKSINLSTNYDNKTIDRLVGLASGNLYADPNIARLIGHYKEFLTLNNNLY